MPGIRQDLPVNYRTATIRTLVQALKAVYNHQTGGKYDYQEEQFRNINITNEWPLKQQDWPAIVVRFQEGQIKNAGVGHVEEFRDDQGLLRRWMHRQFDGAISFELCALSPYDLMVLADSLIEIIAFGSLDPIWSLFYDRIYGNQGDLNSILTYLHQVNLNSDVISAEGEATPTPAPWNPEDVLVFTQSYSVDVWGGFYNNIPGDQSGLGLVNAVQIGTYITVPVELDGTGSLQDGVSENPPFTDDPNNGWSQPVTYHDATDVIGVAQIH